MSMHECACGRDSAGFATCNDCVATLTRDRDELVGALRTMVTYCDAVLADDVPDAVRDLLARIDAASGTAEGEGK